MLAKALLQPNNSLRIIIGHSAVTVFWPVGAAETADKTATSSTAVATASTAAKTTESCDVYIALGEIGCPEIKELNILLFRVVSLGMVLSYFSTPLKCRK